MHTLWWSYNGYNGTKTGPKRGRKLLTKTVFLNQACWRACSVSLLTAGVKCSHETNSFHFLLWVNSKIHHLCYIYNVLKIESGEVSLKIKLQSLKVRCVSKQLLAFYLFNSILVYYFDVSIKFSRFHQILLLAKILIVKMQCTSRLVFPSDRLSDYSFNISNWCYEDCLTQNDKFNVIVSLEWVLILLLFWG